MKLYILHYLDYDDCRIFGVYSTPEKADEERKKSGKFYESYVVVEEFELDAPTKKDS